MHFRINISPHGLSDVPLTGEGLTSSASLRHRALVALRFEHHECLFEGGVFKMKTRLSVDTEKGVLYYILTDCTAQDVENFANLHELRGIISSMELTDSPALDDRAIHPIRGDYSYGHQNTKATVDSFEGNGGHLVFKIRITGENIQSMFDLYRLIRTGKVEPDEGKTWDRTEDDTK